MLFIRSLNDAVELHAVVSIPWVYPFSRQTLDHYHCLNLNPVCLSWILKLVELYNVLSTGLAHTFIISKSLIDGSFSSLVIKQGYSNCLFFKSTLIYFF